MAVTPERLKEMLHDKGELALLDVREQGVFAKEHQLLACCIPLSHLELRLCDLVPRLSTRMVLVDQGPSEKLRLAEKAAERLASFGYSNVAILEGGIEGWRTAGFELFSGVNVLSKAFGEFVETTYNTPRLTAEELNPTSWLFIVLGGKSGYFWILAIVISMCYVFRTWCSVKK